jgi:hypothetical protein
MSSTTVRKRATLAAAALLTGVGLAAGAAPADAAPVQPAQHAAVTSSTAAGDVTAQSSLHRQWGPSWISGSYLTSHGKKWVSQPYRSKGRTAYAYLKCYNTNAKMRVRIYNVEAERYIADSGKVTCNPNKAFHTKTTAFQRLDHLRIVVLGDQGSYVWASYRR